MSAAINKCHMGFILARDYNNDASLSAKYEQVLPAAVPACRAERSCYLQAGLPACSGERVKDHSDSEKGNLLPPHRLLFPINSKGSFICTIPQTG